METTALEIITWRSATRLQGKVSAEMTRKHAQTNVPISSAGFYLNNELYWAVESWLNH